MIELTDEQRRRLVDPEPCVVDPESQQVYVLVRKEAFDRMKALLVLDDYDPDEGMSLMNEVMAEDDARDPLLESYQRYENKR